MKGKIPRITLLGSNSGNNLGDAAILASALASLSKEIPSAEFYVPSSNPKFVNKKYGDKFNVKGVSFMPWTLSVRMIGLSTFWVIAKSDVALICNGIIFGRKLWNPLFNWLINLLFVVPWAKLTGSKVALFCCGIGPFPSKISERMARYVMNLCDLIILRENDSKKLAEEMGVTRKIEVLGDAAFINEVSMDSVALDILRKEGIDPNKALLGINVTSYFDAWLSSSEKVQSKEGFIDVLAQGISKANDELGQVFQPVVFSTHPMDDPVVQGLAELLNGKVILNRNYLSHDIQAVMRRCSLFIGMRFHSLILASAVGTPIVALVYAPKVRGYMRYLKCEDVAVELSTITPDSLSEIIVSAWNSRGALGARQRVIIDELKAGARKAAKRVKEVFFSDIVSNLG